MAASTSKNIGLGVFILLGLLLLTGFVFYIGANQQLFGSTTQLSTVFQNIAGLQPGANVRFSGINVGTVDDIEITSDTTVRLSFRVSNSVVPYIKKDSRTSIGSDGIMGDKILNLSSGTSSQSSISGGDMLASDEPLMMDSIMARASAMATSVSTLTANLADMSSSIRAGKGTIGMLLYDQSLAQRTRGIVTKLNTTVGSLNTNLENTKAGTAAFSENMKALQGNVLFRGYFKKKEKARQDSIRKVEKEAKKREEARQDSIRKVEKATKKQSRIDARNQRRLERKIAKAMRRNKEAMQAINE